ncbi:RnfABCDGE type electron transport complex subunit G [Bacteroidales bacterium OttesenSCG-928-M11]|nr:RnfABCDGE type electron transport complex subunit G [Bacteroidales bacterium OttesenSCG-928-M11]
MKSSLINMFLSLTCICIVSGALLAYVNEVTQEPIRKTQEIKLENSIREVVPGFDNLPTEEMYKVGIAEKDTVFVYPAKQNGKIIGTAIETASKNGFNGEIRILVGLDETGKIINYAVLSHSETPGLGDKINIWFKTNKNNQSILGKDLSKKILAVSKDGGEVDAITASTITSRAFLQAVNKAYVAYSGAKVDSTTQATSTPDAQTDATTQATSAPDTQTDSTTQATNK